MLETQPDLATGTRHNASCMKENASSALEEFVIGSSMATKTQWQWIVLMMAYSGSILRSACAED
jgi:hypothetical protein